MEEIWNANAIVSQILKVFPANNNLSMHKEDIITDLPSRSRCTAKRILTLKAAHTTNSNSECRSTAAGRRKWVAENEWIITSGPSTLSATHMLTTLPRSKAEHTCDDKQTYAVAYLC